SSSLEPGSEFRLGLYRVNEPWRLDSKPGRRTRRFTSPIFTCTATADVGDLRARAEINLHFAAAPRPAGRSPEGRGGEGRVSALLPLLDDVRHRLRRGASHLPARRPRQNVNLFLRDPLGRADTLGCPTAERMI